MQRAAYKGRNHSRILESQYIVAYCSKYYRDLDFQNFCDRNLEDLVVGILDDGSPEMKAAFLGTAASGAKAVKLKGPRCDTHTGSKDA